MKFTIRKIGVYSFNEVQHEWFVFLFPCVSKMFLTDLISRLRPRGGDLELSPKGRESTMEKVPNET